MRNYNIIKIIQINFKKMEIIKNRVIKMKLINKMYEFKTES